MRLAILTSHPVQYYAPLFRELANHLDLHVYFAHKASPKQQAAAGFDTAFSWDVDLENGYSHSYLVNIAREPNASKFSGCDTPEIGDRLLEGEFDVVLSLGWHLKSLLQGIWAAKRQGIPVMIRGDSQLGSTQSTLRRAIKAVSYPALLRTFDAALYVGERNRSYFHHYHYPGERLFHSPHAVDTERFRQGATRAARAKLRSKLKITPEENVVLFAGKLLPFKRPLDAVSAVAEMRRLGTQATLLIAGSGQLETEVAALARQLEVPLRLLGFVNQSKMPEVYAAADALILPSTSRETWGLVCNEALASGLPVAVSEDAGCSADICRDSAAARAFAGGDALSAAIVLKSLLTEPPALEEIAATSDRFTLEKAARGVIEAIEALALR